MGDTPSVAETLRRPRLSWRIWIPERQEVSDDERRFLWQVHACFLLFIVFLIAILPIFIKLSHLLEEKYERQQWE
jgi:hypothetical protein